MKTQTTHTPTLQQAIGLIRCGLTTDSGKTKTNKAQRALDVLSQIERAVNAHEELVNLLKRNLERMKLINGPEQKCIVQNKDEGCANHSLIIETEQAIAKAEGK